VNILAIRFARLGDVLLLLPALARLKEEFPGSRLVFMTGHRCSPIAGLCPAIDEVISVNRIAMRDAPMWEAVRQMMRLVRDVRQRKFDLLIDFHSFRETNLLAALSGAANRVGMKRYGAPYWGFCFNQPPVPEDKSLHVSEMFQTVVSGVAERVDPGHVVAGFSPRPSLVLPGIIRDEKKLVLFVDAPVSDRIWLPERFASVADFAIETFGANVVVISSTSGVELARRVRQASRQPQNVTIETDLTLPRLASTIASARLLVSNDTGPMHIGPAVGVPTLGLFSVGLPEHFRPVGPNDRYLRGVPIERIEVRDVTASVEQMWTTADPGLRR
jgi:ADP-heptose:LPS heptosyltransferase